jgi:hypothetical protein
MHVEETELSAFVNAVKEMFGSEQARPAAEDWFDESEADGQPVSIDQSRLASGHDRGIGSIGRSAERLIG